MRFLALLLFLLAPSAAFAQAGYGAGTSGNASIYTVQDGVTAGGATLGYSNTAGKTLVTSTISTKTLVIPTIGQSLCASENGSSLYTPSSAQVHNFNIYDGLTYKFLDPSLGPFNGSLYSWMGQLGDNLIGDAAAGTPARIIWMPVCIGGSTSAAWATGNLYSRLMVLANWARSLGWPISFVIWQQGQQDAVNGTSSAQYQTNVIGAQGIFKGQGFDVPWIIVDTDTMVSGATNATIQAAQAALINNGAKRYAGPNVDALTVGGGFRLGDQTHLSNTGLTAIAGTGASGMQTAIHNMCTAIGGC